MDKLDRVEKICDLLLELTEVYYLDEIEEALAAFESDQPENYFKLMSATN